MATLTNEARHKARQIRELSRDLNTDHSVASSTGSHHGTVSDDTSTTFDPMEDGDCFMSTDLMNYHLNAQNSSQTYSQKLPELRDTAKKYNRWAPRAPDSTPPPFSINQSALDRAFPDFDSGPILSTDEFDIGRASKTKQRSPYRAPPREFSSNMDSQSHVVTVDKVAINHTPTSRLQQKTRRTSQTRSLSGLEKSARWLEQNLRPKSPSIILPEHPQLPAYSEPNSDPLVFSSPFITTPPERVMPTKTRKVVPMPAHVTNESDNSFVSDAPSKQSYAQIRSSRKSPSPTAKGYGQQTKRSPSITTIQTHALHQTQSSPSVSKIQTHITHQTDKSPTTTQTYTAQQSKKSTSTTPSQTQHSFALPAQTGDVSRLLSGKSLSSESIAQGKKTMKRAQSISTDQTRKRREQKDFVEEDDEEEEIDIYEKAETLQRELDSLKALRQQDMSFIGELQKDRTALEREVEILENEKEQGFRRDSGVGSFNSNELHDDVEVISKERDDLRIQLSRKTELLMKTKEDLNGDVGALSSELNELRSQLTLKTQEHKRTRDDLRSKIDALSYELDELRRELTQKQQDLAKAKAEVHASVGSISKERDELQNELQKLKKTIEDLKDNIEKLISQRDEVSRVLTRKNEGLVRAYEDVHSEVEGLCVERDEVRRALTRKSQELDRANKYFTTEVEDSHNELEAIRKERDELRKERDELRRERDELRKGLNEARGASRHENPESVTSRQSRSVPEDTMPTEISMQSDSYATVERTMERIARSSAEEHREEDNSTKERTMERIARPTSEDYDEENLEYSRSTNPGADDTIESQKSAHSERSSYSRQSGFSQKSSHSHRSTHPQRPSLSQRSVLSQKSGAREGSRLESSAQKESTPNKISNKMPTGILKKTSAFYHQSQRRSKHIDEDMTSAFILPDIISPARDEDTKDHPALTPSARGVLDELCQHYMRNCIVCARVATADPESSCKHSGKIHVSKPVPVSERMPVVEPYEDEPTLRPSVPPGVALATVIKAMKDEIEHLKMKQADVLNLYNKVDTSLGMREKKRLYTQLTMATAERDSKEDQLYALYDVLEGQKAAKQEVDTSFDIDEELPWEGIEDSE